MGGAGCQGVTRTEQKLLARLMQIRVWYLPEPTGTGHSKGTMAVTALLSGTKPPTSPCPKARQLPQHSSSEQLGPSKPILGPPLQEEPRDSRSPPSHSATICWFSQLEVIVSSLPGIRTLGCGEPDGTGIPHSSGGTSAARISLPTL